MEEEPTQKSRIEQFVQVGVVVFLLVTTAIFFTHGINVSGTTKQLAATAASVPPPPVQKPSAPAPAVPPPPVSREEATGCPKGASCQTSQPKEIKPVGDCADPKASPQIQAECKQQEAIAKSQIARCTQGEKKSEVCKPYEISKVVYTSKSCFLKSGETIVKCKPKPTPECPTVSSTTGALCTWESKDPNCQCKKGGEENNKKPDDAPVAKSTDDIAKQVSGTEDGQGGGSGSGGSPGGGGQSPQDEAIAQAFEDPNTPPLPEQRSEALKQHDQELAQQIEQAEQALDNYYDSDVQNLEEERRLNENYERLVQERAELAPYVRQALLDDKQEIDANPSSSNWPSERQNIDGRISELDRLMQEYGVQGGGQREYAGVPYSNPYGSYGALEQVESPYVGASYYSCLQSQGSVCYGGDGVRTEQNRLRDGDIAITPQLRQSIGLRHNEIADVLLEGPNGNRAWATVRDEIGFGNEIVPNYAPGAGQRVHIDYFRPPGQTSSSLMSSLGLERSMGLQGNVRVVLVRRF